MTNENTIYECSIDNTRWYGSDQSPEVCPVCGAEGSISLPQEFATQVEKDAVIASVEPIIEAIPLQDDVNNNDNTVDVIAEDVIVDVAPIDSTEEIPVEEVSDVASVEAAPDVVESEVSDQVAE